MTYICQADAAGIVEGYGLNVQPGDHIWRIRHRSGPATDFSTNFLSDVQGHINVGETLYFVTPQSANGVKVITSPLDNLYGGTASVSGSICSVPEEPKGGSLTLTSECLGNGSIQWTVTNTYEKEMPFKWKTTSNENGEGSVPANSFTTFETTVAGNELTLFYLVDEQEAELSDVAVVCDSPKTTVDAQPDVAAGGMGPSLVTSLAPFVTGIFGLGAASILTVKSKKVTK